MFGSHNILDDQDHSSFTLEKSWYRLFENSYPNLSILQLPDLYKNDAHFNSDGGWGALHTLRAIGLGPHADHPFLLYAALAIKLVPCA